MKRIHKILLTAVFSVTLFCIPVKSPQAEAAGLPTIDFSNLLTNISEFLQNQDIAGMFESTSGVAFSVDEFREKIATWKQYIDLAMSLAQGYTYCREIAEMLEDIQQETVFLYNSAAYFMEKNAVASIALGAISSYKEFAIFGRELQDDFTQIFRFITDRSARKDPLAVLESLEMTVREFRQKFYNASVHYRMKMARYYSMQRCIEMAVANDRYLDIVII